MSLIADLAAAAEGLARARPRVLVAVDGPDAAGKTTLADSLADRLRVPVVRAGVDGFHRPRSARYARGAGSPVGYYRDSFDQVALVGGLLAPFAAGAPMVRTACFDHLRDEAAARESVVPEVAVLVVDGVFLLRPELRRHWHLAVYLHVPPDESLRRGVARDSCAGARPAEVAARYRARYLPGQSLYRAEADPLSHADVVADTTDPAAPMVLRWDAAARGQARRATRTR